MPSNTDAINVVVHACYGAYAYLEIFGAKFCFQGA